MATKVVTATEEKQYNNEDKLVEFAESLHTKPLWKQMAKLIPPLPNPTCIPHIWRYSNIRPSLLSAGDLVSEKQAERRVLMLINPARGTSEDSPCSSRQDTC